MRFLWRRRARATPSPAGSDEAPEEAFAQLLLDEGREELERADNKASILLGAAGLVLGIFLGGAVAGDWDPTELGDGRARAVFWAGIAFAMLGVLRLGLAVVPRIKHDEAKEKLAYFGHVIQFREGWALRRSARARRDARGRSNLRDAICTASRGRFDRTVDQVCVGREPHRAAQVQAHPPGPVRLRPCRCAVRCRCPARHAVVT